MASSTNVIYYTPATDPYTTLANWNRQLQNTLSANLTGPATTLAANNAAYDIGHMFGASGGGGNAGCIGCVCVNDTASTTDQNKGAGITSPADGIPQGDNFDIDYVVHEVGHQLGGTHTFSNNNEGSGTNKEVGSGITIMGYAGITGQDLAPHSIDIFHETSIEQIQANIQTKTCPVITNISATNATPVVAAVSNYTIPKSTPFVLTGSATDANAGDALTYCWEQNDDGGSSTGANSSASITKTVGPNFLSWPATASPSRYFPKLTSTIANSATTSQVGGDAGMLSEALSSVARTLNFRLTVRDNCPYSSTAPLKVGQTAFTDMVVTVNAVAGPFLVSAPNTAVSWAVGTNQTVTWDVAGTTGNGVNAANVDIYLSTDGGLTYPILLASKVPNDGSETVTVPNNIGSTNRIMVKGNNHIFFDISNTNFTIAAPTSSFGVSFNGVAGDQSKDACTGAIITYTFPYTTYGGFTGNTTFSATGLPIGTIATFTPSSTSVSGMITMTISGTPTGPLGFYSIVMTATSGAITRTVPFYLNLFNSNFATLNLTSPANLATSQSTSLSLTWQADTNATLYDVQVATDNTFITIINSATVATNSYSLSGLNSSTDYFWRVLPKNSSCSGSYSSTYKFTTGLIVCATTSSSNVPVTIPTTVATVTSTLNIPSGVSISDLNVAVNITHTWINDLTLSLTSPAGTTVVLVANPCNANASVNNIAATFDDAGTAFTCGDFPGLSGTILPNQALSVFNGQSSTGTWTLTVADAFNADGGSLNNWSLNICSVAPLGVDENGLQNFALYPNPNNGNFTVQFNSTSDNEIAIDVNDIRGREVFSKKYQNSGLFNENLNLDNLQAGVYLVSVQDGNKKVVKKIIVE